MKERLSLLQQHQVISHSATVLCLKAVALIEQELRLSTDSEQFQMAITHLARAYDRITVGEPIQVGLDSILWQEVITDPAYPMIEKLNSKLLSLLQLTNEVPSAENSFLMSNWLSLYYAAEEMSS